MKYPIIGPKPIISLDIDGVLGDYHGHLFWFAEKYFGHSMPQLETVDVNDFLWKRMNVTEMQYRDMKTAYRQGGLKRFMPATPGASVLAFALSHSGAEVWICSSRSHQLPIATDTRHWLKRNLISYANLIFNPDKYQALVEQARDKGQEVIAVVDDEKGQALEAHIANAGKVYLYDRPYNASPLFEDDIPVTHRVHDLTELRQKMTGDILDWRRANEH